MDRTPVTKQAFRQFTHSYLFCKRRRTHMNLNPSSGQITRSTPDRVDSQHGAQDGLNEKVNDLRRDLASLKDNFARLASQAGGEAVKTMRGVRETVAAQVGGAAGGVADASSDLAVSAKEHAQTFASELERMARQNPLATIAGAVLVGAVIGMVLRGRS
jgi:ElaB/YqjD/DUF883 family membrane-anchored ribosome-binding protein